MLINVIGFGWSGSGALLDCMRQDLRFNVIPQEINFISDPTGIVNLFEKLCNPNDFNSKAHAIENFVKLLDISFRSHIPKFRYGQNLGKFTNKKLDDELELLLQQLNVERTNLNSRVDFYDLNVYQYWIKLIKNMLKISEQKFAVNSQVDSTQFRESITSFLENLFQLENTYTVLDQGLRIEHLAYNDVIFHNLKTIIVNRNPKDIYSEQIKGRFLFGANPTTENIKNFCKNYSSQYSLASSKIGKNVTMIDFEDLVFDQKSTLRKISTFLNIPPIEISSGFLYPSRKNIKIYNSYLNQQQRELIDQNIRCIKRGI